jgi:putative hydrolase of the HAD superfamily
MIKGVFFDLYGTLLVYGDMTSAWKDWLAAFHRSFLRLGLKESESEFALLCDGFFARTEPPFQHDGLTVLERRIQEFALELGVEVTTIELAEVASEMILAWQSHVTLDPEAIPVLEKLRDRFKTALITNFDHPPHVHTLLDHHNLVRLFDDIVISAEAGVSKPDPGIFDSALKRTGLTQEAVAYVGDSIEDDVAGALAAGLYPVHLHRIREDGSTVDFDYRRSGNEGSGAERQQAGIEGGCVIHRLSELLDLFG